MNRVLEGRQGDVAFVRTTIPKDAQPIKLRPFALGEVTGHSHRVAPECEALVEMYEKDGLTYIRATGDITMIHEDHDPTGKTSILPGGWEGEVVIAQEYTPEGIRSVMD